MCPTSTHSERQNCPSRVSIRKRSLHWSSCTSALEDSSINTGRQVLAYPEEDMPSQSNDSIRNCWNFNGGLIDGLILGRYPRGEGIVEAEYGVLPTWKEMSGVPSPAAGGLERPLNSWMTSSGIKRRIGRERIGQLGPQVMADPELVWVCGSYPRVVAHHPIRRRLPPLPFPLLPRSCRLNE